MAERNDNKGTQTSLASKNLDRNPWNISRHLPESDDLEELRRCFNLVWKEFYNVEQAATTISQQLFSNMRSASSFSSSADAAALVPAWTRSISPPFALIACNPDGSIMVDSRGYGVIQKVL